MPDLPLPSPEHLDLAAVARCERLLDLAPYLGIDPADLAAVQRRLIASEHERWQGDPTPERAKELDALIADETETLCLALKRLTRMVEGMGSA